MRTMRYMLLLGLFLGAAVISAIYSPSPISREQVNTNSMKLEASTSGPTYLFEWNRSWGEYDIAELAYAVTVDSQRHILIAGSAQNLGFLAEYNCTGALLWNRTWTDPEWMVFRDIGILEDGTICLLVQRSTGSYIIGKVNRTACVGICELGLTEAYCFAIDNRSNIYVTGYVPLKENWAFLQKYNSSNQLEWNITLDVPSVGTSVAVAPDGNVFLLYLTGELFNVMKIDGNGTCLWNRTYSGFGESCWATNIGIDTYSNIYVAGQTSIYFSPANYDILLCKFNATGALLWNGTWGGVSNEFCDHVHHLAIDSFNNSYVTGYTGSFKVDDIDAFVAKFDTAGTFQWVYTWGGNGTEEGLGIAMDSEGNIYNTGYYQPAELQGNALLVKYGIDSDGDNLTNDLERYTYGTNATNPDSDGDTLPDGLERRLGLDPLNATDAWADFDGDGLNNRAEYWNGTGLWNPDSDGDGLTDGQEVLTYRTLPRVADTDKDGFTDGAEVAAGTNPLDPTSYPTTTIPGFSVLAIIAAIGILIHWKQKLKLRDLFQNY